MTMSDKLQLVAASKELNRDSRQTEQFVGHPGE